MKYIEQRTTSSIWQEVNSGLRLPYLTICPSYNAPKDHGPLGKFPHILAEREDNNVTNVTETEIEEYWINKTFDASDSMYLIIITQKSIYQNITKFSYVALSILKVNGKRIYLPSGPLIDGVTVHNVSVTEKWVGWGRCYMIDWTNTTKRLDQVLIILKHQTSYKAIGQ